jgi:hypothetical protein
MKINFTVKNWLSIPVDITQEGSTVYVKADIPNNYPLGIISALDKAYHGFSIENDKICKVYYNIVHKNNVVKDFQIILKDIYSPTY